MADAKTNPNPNNKIQSCTFDDDDHVKAAEKLLTSHDIKAEYERDCSHKDKNQQRKTARDRLQCVLWSFQTRFRAMRRRRRLLQKPFRIQVYRLANLRQLSLVYALIQQRVNLRAVKLCSFYATTQDFLDPHSKDDSCKDSLIAKMKRKELRALDALEDTNIDEMPSHAAVCIELLQPKMVVWRMDPISEILPASCDTDCAQCIHCESPAVKAKLCGRCRKAWYCNAECQRADWQQHKLDCVIPLTTTTATDSKETETDVMPLTAGGVGVGVTVVALSSPLPPAADDIVD